MGLMEDTIKKAQAAASEEMTRRKFLRNTAAVTVGGLGAFYLAGCGGTEETTTTAGAETTTTAGETTTTVAGETTTTVDAAALWKQWDGTKLTFITENTPPSSAFKTLLPDFLAKTGIEVDMIQDDDPIVLEKVLIDFRGESKQYQVSYDQDKLMGGTCADFYMPLDKFFTDTTVPLDPAGYGDDSWLPNILTVCGRFFTADKVVGLPYDTAIATFFYRKDMFEKFSADFEKEFGYPMVYNAPDANYKNILEWTQFIKKARSDTDPYGFGLHAANFAWTTQLDMQRICFSHGQWLEFTGVDDKLGAKKPTGTNWGDEQSIKCLQWYKDCFDAGSPDALALGTLELSDATKAGKIGMLNQYQEFITTTEDEKTSTVAGKMAYDLVPKGAKEYLVDQTLPLVNGSNNGIGGISINGQLDDTMAKATWAFVAWVTSPEVQKKAMITAGANPTRLSVFNDPELVAAQGTPYPAGSATGRTGSTTYKNTMAYPSTLPSLSDPNIVFGPKIPNSQEYFTLMANEVWAMCGGKLTPAQCAASLKDKVGAFVTALPAA
jgi:multiple sugar transport system substrate-binding protein